MGAECLYNRTIKFVRIRPITPRTLPVDLETPSFTFVVEAAAGTPVNTEVGTIALETVIGSVEVAEGMIG